MLPLPSSFPALAWLGLWPRHSQGLWGSGLQGWGLLEVPELPAHRDHGDAASLEQKLTASTSGMEKSEPAAAGHEGSETRGWRE